jgi:hypothetical protein
MALLGRYAAQSGVALSTDLSLGGATFSSAGTSTALPFLLSDTAIMVFGMLALLELFANSSEYLRLLYEEVLWLLQPGSAFAVNYSFADWQVSSFVEMVRRMGPAPVLALDLPSTGVGLLSTTGHHYMLSASALAGVLAWAAPLISLAWAALLAVGAWLLGRVRAAVVGMITLIDEGNSLGLQSLLHWSETAWVAIATYLIIFLPVLALALAGITVAALFLTRWYFDRRERLALIPCAHCGAPIHPTAPACHSCRQRQEQPRCVGLFGQPKDLTVSDMTVHRLELIARKRCPVCATRLKERAVRQICTGCGTPTFADMGAINVYMRSLQQRLPRTLVICFLFGLIPVIGMVPGVAYYRLSLIASLKGYVPRTTGCLTGWGLRIAGLVLLSLQPIPVLGSLTLPAMCLLNYSVYRKVIEGIGASTIGRAFEPAAAPISGALLAGASPNGASEAIACPQCTQIQSRANFCVACGARLSA